MGPWWLLVFATTAPLNFASSCQTSCSCEPSSAERGPRAWCRGLRRMPSLLDPQTEFLSVTTTNISSLRKTDTSFYLQLSELDVSNNVLSSIAPDAFEPLGRTLRLLNLSQNRLRTLPDRVFSELHSLKGLDLSFNEGLTLTVSTLHGLSSLESLNLAHCGLSRLPPLLLKPLSSLEELNLEGNRFLSFPYLLSDTPALLSLNLHANLIGNLDALAAFDGESRVQSLDLSENVVSALHREHLLALPALTHLNLSDNQLDSLPGNAWEGVTALEELDLSRNYFPQLHTSSFDSLPSLRSLDLSHSSKLRAVQVLSLTSLRRLTFSHSPLSSLPSSAFSPPVSLDSLDVSYCELSSLPPFLLSSLSLLLEGNDWHCDCSFRASFPLPVSGVCSSPDSLSGVSLSSLSPCSLLDHVPLLVGVVLVLVLLTVLLILLCIRPRRARSPLLPSLDGASFYEKGDLLPSTTSNSSPVYSHRIDSSLESPYLVPNTRPFLPHHPAPPIEEGYTVIADYPVPITRL